MQPTHRSPRSASRCRGTGEDLAHRPLGLRIFPDAVLRQVAQPIQRVDRHVSALAKDMLELMRANRGIGLAAPQVGLRVRLIVADVGDQPIVIVNPRLSVSGPRDWMSEGCLSLPQVYVEIERATAIEVRGRGINGARLHFRAAGLLARVIQHEVDHLEGVLICDYADPRWCEGDLRQGRGQLGDD